MHFTFRGRRYTRALWFLAQVLHDDGTFSIRLRARQPGVAPRIFQ